MQKVKVLYINLTGLSRACFKWYKDFVCFVTNQLCKLNSCHIFFSIRWLVQSKQVIDWWLLPFFKKKKKKTLQPLFKDGVLLSQDHIANIRRQFTFCQKAPRSSWHSFGRHPKDERLSWPWRHPVVFSLRPLDSVL